MFTDRAANYVARKKTMIHQTCDSIAHSMGREAKQVAQWTDRTSHARQSINSGLEVRGDTFILYVAHGARYGRYLESGTPAHVILPKHKKALYWAGAPHPVKKVNHPGTRKYPAVVPAAEKGQRDLKRAMQVLWGV